MRVTVKNVLILSLISSVIVAEWIMIHTYEKNAVVVVSLAVFFAMFNILMTKIAKVFGFEFDIDDGKVVVDAERGRRPQAQTQTETPQQQSQGGESAEPNN